MRPLLDFPRILHVLRRGPAGKRAQAWLGVVLIAISALGVLVFVLWKMLVLLAVFGCGVFLIRRSVQGSRSSSS